MRTLDDARTEPTRIGTELANMTQNSAPRRGRLAVSQSDIVIYAQISVPYRDTEHGRLASRLLAIPRRAVIRRERRSCPFLELGRRARDFDFGQVDPIAGRSS